MSEKPDEQCKRTASPCLELYRLSSPLLPTEDRTRPGHDDDVAALVCWSASLRDSPCQAILDRVPRSSCREGRPLPGGDSRARLLQMMPLRCLISSSLQVVAFP